MNRPQSKAAGSLKPVTGTYTVPKNRLEKIAASHAFDAAWDNAIQKAVQQWGPTNEVKVDVQYRARIDIWNPGGVGWCAVTLIPGSG
jgi:hypothetical protein